MDGLTFLRKFREKGGSALVIVMSAYGGEDAAIAAMKEGGDGWAHLPAQVSREGRQRVGDRDERVRRRGCRDRGDEGRRRWMGSPSCASFARRAAARW